MMHFLKDFVYLTDRAKEHKGDRADGKGEEAFLL